MPSSASSIGTSAITAGASLAASTSGMTSMSVVRVGAATSRATSSAATGSDGISTISAITVSGASSWADWASKSPKSKSPRSTSRTSVALASGTELVTSNACVLSKLNSWVDTKSTGGGTAAAGAMSRSLNICVDAKSAEISGSASAGISATANSTEGASGSCGASGATAKARPGTCKGRYWPSRRSASAVLRNSWVLQGVVAWVAMSSTQRSNACMACSDTETNASLAGRCSAREVLSNCSKAHAASPKSLSPTMRELPLRVWNARRSVVWSARLVGSARRAANAANPFWTTSRASSRKMSRNSASSSASGSATGTAADMTGAGADTGAGAATACGATAICKAAKSS